MRMTEKRIKSKKKMKISCKTPYMVSNVSLFPSNSHLENFGI